MDVALGLLGLLVFIVGILALSATVTFGVVKADEVIRKRIRRARAA